MLKNFRKKYIGDADFYRHIMYIATPMIIQNAITSFVSFVDNIMVGRIGTEEMSGVAIVNQLIFVFQICIFGAISGASIFGTQFYGKGDYNGQKQCFRFKMYGSIIISLIVILLFGMFSTEFIGLFLSAEGQIGNIDLALKYGEEYMAIMLIGALPFALAQAYISTIRETGHTFVPMLASIVAVVINVILDAILIFGLLGLPKLGVVGAAIATVIARYIECIIVLMWTHRKKDTNLFINNAYSQFSIEKNILKDILKKGTPLMLNEVLWVTGMTTIVQCYSVRGLEAVAGLNISTTITNLFNIVYIQLGACIAIVVGQLLGAGDIKKAKDNVNKLMFFSVISCVGIGAIMIIFADFFPQIYKVEPQIRELARNFIIISAAVMPLCAYAHSAYFTLRSGGKTIITFIFDSLYTWVVVIPCAFILTRHTDLAIVLVFLIVQCTEIIKVIMGYFMIRSGVWIQTIVD